MRALRRFAEQLIFLFDDDSAGQKAGERAEGLPEKKEIKIADGLNKGESAVDLAQTIDFDVKIVTLGKYKDPADAVVGDVNYFLDAVAHPKYPIEIAIDRLPKGLVDYTERENLNSLRFVIRKIMILPSPVQREEWFKKFSQATGVPQKVLEGEAVSVTDQQSERSSAKVIEEAPKRQISRQELIIEQLLSAALTKDDFAAIDDCVFFFAPAYKEVAALLKSGKRSSTDLALDAVIGTIVLRSSDIVLGDAEITFLKNALAKEYYKERRQIIALAIKNAEANGNDAELAAALEELTNLPMNKEDL